MTRIEYEQSMEYMEERQAEERDNLKKKYAMANANKLGVEVGDHIVGVNGILIRVDRIYYYLNSSEKPVCIFFGKSGDFVTDAEKFSVIKVDKIIKK